MRAAVFVNAVAIRRAVSLEYGFILPEECVRKLQSANYRFHSALNSYLVANPWLGGDSNVISLD